MVLQILVALQPVFFRDVEFAYLPLFSFFPFRGDVAQMSFGFMPLEIL